MVRRSGRAEAALTERKRGEGAGVDSATLRRLKAKQRLAQIRVKIQYFLNRFN
jgi:hypothetical protein